MGGRLKRTVIVCEQALLFGRASRECASEGVAASRLALLSQIGTFARRLGSLLPCVADFRQNNCYSATLRYTPWILSHIIHIQLPKIIIFFLDQAATDLLVHQKQLTVGIPQGGHEEVITRLVDCQVMQNRVRIQSCEQNLLICD